MIRKLLSLILACLAVTTSAFSEENRPIRVYADIVGDFLHNGHIEFFKKCLEFGDELVVGVLSDETVATYKRVPIMTLDERVAMVEGCKYAAEVIPAPPLRTSEEWLKEHNIDIVVHGDDISEEMLWDQYEVPMKLGIMRLVPYTKGVSSTMIIGRVKDR